MRVRWPNVWVIFRREVRDQVRDRRTLFMIFVLPILLYPILGIGVVQFSAAFEQKPRTVLVRRGREPARDAPAAQREARRVRRLALRRARPRPTRLKVTFPETRRALARPRTTASRRSAPASPTRSCRSPPTSASGSRTIASEQLPINYDSTDERSQITYLRLKEVLSRWKEAVVDAAVASTTSCRRATPTRSRSRPRTRRASRSRG